MFPPIGLCSALLRSVFVFEYLLSVLLTLLLWVTILHKVQIKDSSTEKDVIALSTPTQEPLGSITPIIFAWSTTIRTPSAYQPICWRYLALSLIFNANFFVFRSRCPLLLVSQAHYHSRISRSSPRVFRFSLSFSYASPQVRSSVTSFCLTMLTSYRKTVPPSATTSKTSKRKTTKKVEVTPA